LTEGVVFPIGKGNVFSRKIHPIKEGGVMGESILTGKKILAVDDEPDVLTVLEEEIKETCLNCVIDKASSYETAVEKLKSQTYDVVILDIMGVRGFDLLELAVKMKFRVAMLTAHALSPEALKKSIELGARAYLPKEKLGEIVPFLEDVLTFDYIPGWKRLYEKLKGFFDQKFETGWEKRHGLSGKDLSKWNPPYE
jgi:CheY-like chemotaxis protein